MKVNVIVLVFLMSLLSGCGDGGGSGPSVAAPQEIEREQVIHPRTPLLGNAEQTCALQEGSLCQSTENCDGEWYRSSDTEACCMGSCTDRTIIKNTICHSIPPDNTVDIERLPNGEYWVFYGTSHPILGRINPIRAQLQWGSTYEFRIGQESFIFETVEEADGTFRLVLQPRPNEPVESPLPVSEYKGYIVEFEDRKEAIGVGKNEGNNGQYRTAHKEFTNRLVHDIQSTPSPLQAHISAPSIQREFSTLLNGVTIDMNDRQAMIAESLSYVKRVSKNLKMQLNLGVSVPSINVPTVWNSVFDGEGRQVTGKGVDIAIIDTGVDYTHPDLGGCFGAVSSDCSSEPGLLAYYTFDGTVDDISPHNNHATLVGARYVEGRSGQALDFAQGGRVETPIDVHTNTLPTTTWEAWVKPTGNDGESQYIFSAESSGAYYGQRAFHVGNYGGRYVADAPSFYIFRHAEWNTWEHIAVVFTPTHVKLYRNGEFEESQEIQLESEPTVVVPLVIGGFGTYEFSQFKGIIDEVAIYDRELSESEVYAHYRQGLQHSRICGGSQPCKVSSGFDFADSDDDPMDEHGHGTHVASIAAGRGRLLGVAPDASIIAYKVTRADGTAYVDTFLAALERAADPNQDGNTSDHHDVVSISLSAVGTPDDLLSQAVDNLVDAGAIVTAAAGNSLVVGTPGTARKAITVGASHPQYGIARFSATGPVRWYDANNNRKFLFKPDVIAPGEQICAAKSSRLFGNIGHNAPPCIDNQHFKLSGTSMATPHVAGLAALIKQQHPEYTPLQIKHIIRNGAQKNPILIARQEGQGRIDAMAAVEAMPVIAEFREGGELLESDSLHGYADALEMKEYRIIDEDFSRQGTPKQIYSSADSVVDGELLRNSGAIVPGEWNRYLTLVVEDETGQTSEDVTWVRYKRYCSKVQ